MGFTRSLVKLLKVSGSNPVKRVSLVPCLLIDNIFCLNLNFVFQIIDGSSTSSIDF